MPKSLFIFDKKLNFIAQCTLLRGECVLHYPLFAEPNANLGAWVKEITGRNLTITKEVRNEKQFAIIQKEVSPTSEEYINAVAGKMRQRGFITYIFDERMTSIVQEILKANLPHDDRVRAFATMQNLDFQEDGEELLAFLKKLRG